MDGRQRRRRGARDAYEGADYACNCGEHFAGTLAGAWQAKLHAEDEGHRLRPAPSDVEGERLRLEPVWLLP